MDQLIAQILYISAQLMEEHFVQETVWAEALAQMVNAYATKAIKELIVV